MNKDLGVFTVLKDSDHFDHIEGNFLAKEKQNIDSFQMNISAKAIFPTDSVDLLGVTIHNRLNFEKHISSLCRKAGP